MTDIEINSAVWRMMVGIGRIECKREEVVTQIILHPLEDDHDIAARAACTPRTVRKWRPHAYGYYVAVKTDAGTLRVRLKAPMPTAA